MADTLYVNKPGGVIVHLSDGRSKNLSYGDPVPNDLADYVDSSKFADDRPRRAAEDTLEAEAHARAALAEGGQVNSGSSPVPGNYANLDEDAAAQLVANLSRYPEAQAKILIHERLLGGNRQKVLDAATDAARISAEIQLAQEGVIARPSGDAGGPPAPGPIDPGVGGGDDANVISANDAAYADLATPAPTSGDGDSSGDASTGGDGSGSTEGSTEPNGSTEGDGNGDNPPDFDSMTGDQLDAYVEQAGGIEGYKKSATVDERRDFLKSQNTPQ